MNRPSRSMRKLLDSVATNNEVAALDMMRAAEQLQARGASSTIA